MKRRHVIIIDSVNSDVVYDIDIGDQHAIANKYLADSNAKYFSWGINDHGELGLNNNTNQCTPISLLGAKKTFCKISTGDQHNICVDNNKMTWSWGYNAYGQLGVNSTTSKRTPVSILGAKKTFCKISAGENISAGITHTGSLWLWGVNQYGQLGDNTVTSKQTPVNITGSTKTFCEIGVQQSCGAIEYNGQVWCWGYNPSGQLGDNTAGTGNCKCTPVSILGNKKTFCSISVGGNFVLALDYNGLLWSWGNNSGGQLGVNSTTSKKTPVSILGAKKTFCKIYASSASNTSSSAIDNYGQVWTWGYNNYGQLGVIDTINRCTPVSILGSKKTFCKIRASQYFMFGVDNHGRFWSWGRNLYGELGDGNVSGRCTPISILGNRKNFYIISCGGNHSMSLDENGKLWSWGEGDFGKLGNDSLLGEYTPVSILGNPKTIYTGNTIGCSTSNSCFLDSSGLVWTWGTNASGQLGIGSTTSKRTPVSILGDKKTFCKISFGAAFVVAIDKNGLVWSWGNNLSGQLGIYTVTSKQTPVSILGSKKTFCEISNGTTYVIAIDNHGVAWSWGSNTSGTLGDNSIVSKCTPVLVLGATKNFCKVFEGSGNSTFSAVIDNSGLTWSWGINTYGQLGDNSVSSRLTPVSILGAKKTFCQIALGQSHTVALDYKGQIWCWGSNTSGQLGVDSITAKCTPVSILGAKKTFCEIAAGSSFTFGITYDYQVWGWGYNLYGELGNNYITTTPIRVCRLH